MSHDYVYATRCFHSHDNHLAVDCKSQSFYLRYCQKQIISIVLHETRDFQVEFGRDVAFATTAGTISSAPDVLNQEKLAIIDSTQR